EKIDPGVANNHLIFPTKKMLDNVHIIDAKALNNEKYLTTWQNLISAQLGRLGLLPPPPGADAVPAARAGHALAGRLLPRPARLPRLPVAPVWIVRLRV